jgi:20S proteasome alpha/beta subunit
VLFQKEARAMTIAAGFKFDGGILLCADTEQTQGELKFDSSKIVTVDLRPACTVAFALAGDVAYATMAIQEMKQELNRAETDHQSIEDLIKAKLSDIYTRLIYPHPRAAYGDAPSFDLLIAVWSEGDSRLLATHDTAVSEVFTYECIGAGLSLAKYLIKPLYKIGISRRNVEMIAARTLTHVKSNVAYCGQQSEFIVLESDGLLSKRTLASQHQIIDTLDTFLPVVFFSAADLTASDDDVKNALKALETCVLNERHRALNKAWISKDAREI